MAEQEFQVSKFVNDEQARVLRDRGALIDLLRTSESQGHAAKRLGISINQVMMARIHHGIPVRPQAMPVWRDLSGVKPRDAVADHEILWSLLNRAHCRAGLCPPHCRYWERPTCPKAATIKAHKEGEFDGDLDGDFDDDDIRAMHPDCPILYYDGPTRNGNTSLQQAIREAGMNLMRRKRQPREEIEEPIEEPREPDTPDTFLQFLDEVKEGG